MANNITTPNLPEVVLTQDSPRKLEEQQGIIYPLVSSIQSEENFKQEFQIRLDDYISRYIYLKFSNFFLFINFANLFIENLNYIYLDSKSNFQ